MLIRYNPSWPQWTIFVLLYFVMSKTEIVEFSVAYQDGFFVNYF